MFNISITRIPYNLLQKSAKINSSHQPAGEPEIIQYFKPKQQQPGQEEKNKSNRYMEELIYTSLKGEASKQPLSSVTDPSSHLHC